MKTAAKKILVVAPHPDDETLGCGGTLYKHRDDGDEIHWLVLTAMHGGYSHDAIAKRKNEIEQVKAAYGFKTAAMCDLPTTRLDSIPLAEIIEKMAAVFNDIEPDTLYLPYGHDAHSDHRIAFDAGTALSKWFRRKNLKNVYAYETVSETEFQMDPAVPAFKPNYYVDISSQLAKKLDTMKIFESELKAFPFPRSIEAITAQAKKRGSECGKQAAEAFIQLWSVQ